jgi:hypothetical protein
MGNNIFKYIAINNRNLGSRIRHNLYISSRGCGIVVNDAALRPVSLTFAGAPHKPCLPDSVHWTTATPAPEWHTTATSFIACMPRSCKLCNNVYHAQDTFHIFTHKQAAQWQRGIAISEAETSRRNKSTETVLQIGTALQIASLQVNMVAIRSTFVRCKLTRCLSLSSAASWAQSTISSSENGQTTLSHQPSDRVESKCRSDFAVCPFVACKAAQRFALSSDKMFYSASNSKGQECTQRRPRALIRWHLSKAGSVVVKAPIPNHPQQPWHHQIQGTARAARCCKLHSWMPAMALPRPMPTTS